MFILIEEYIQQDKPDRQKHLELTEDCIEIGTNSQQCRALLAHYVKTTVPRGYKIHLCHACNNDKCSNPKHLYWGTARENNLDIRDFYGFNPGAEAMRGKKWSHTKESREKISKATKGKPSNNELGINQYTKGS
jgi:hypothetical protein